MKHALRQSMGQQLSLTPQLLQSIRLLHLNAIDLEREVARALEDNPLLEADADDHSDTDVEQDVAPVELEESYDFAVETRMQDYVDPGLSRMGAGSGEDDPVARCMARETGGVRQFVLEQFRLELKRSEDLALAEWLVDQVDDAGYLEMSLELLEQAAIQRFGHVGERVRALREQMLRLEPAGYGAADLRECLLVQLDLRDHDEAGFGTAKQILRDHLHVLGSHDHNALAAALGVEADEVICAERLIMSLDPKPGGQHESEPQQYVIPDVIVRKGRHGAWVVSLNPLTAPKVRISPFVESVLDSAADESGMKRMRELLQDARWLTRGLSMRYDTLLKTTQAIVERQLAFFDRGEEGMRPLTLREVADAIGMHESSISRITTGKYVQTPRGTFELKYFFAVRLEGASVAGVAVRAMVKRLIEGENRSSPLADDTIVSLLARQGIHIARRTVAKYREMLHIASAKERREPGLTSHTSLRAHAPLRQAQ
ncbi:MAG: RNA polymerase sigma-54 factor [Alphaproteobacteria bacterium ADurb.BinA280]|jgi:RNA polymerase sigma-54 factor|nr:RNA polymerase factor sigma-54 [Xanthomonadales bacterium]OPZ13578.1 MAG: RNA polymerase sigma-54 factor [Alphaproteobacteria bacterium ADurb.BinA280]